MNLLDVVNGASALDACNAYRLFLVLMDKCLPDTDGIELTTDLIPAVAAAIGIAPVAASHSQQADTANIRAMIASAIDGGDLCALLRRDLSPGPFHVSTGRDSCLRTIPILTFSTTTPDVPGTGVDRIQVTSQAYSSIPPRQCLSARSGERFTVERCLKKISQ